MNHVKNVLPMEELAEEQKHTSTKENCNQSNLEMSKNIWILTLR